MSGQGQGSHHAPLLATPTASYSSFNPHRLTPPNRRPAPPADVAVDISAADPTEAAAAAAAAAGKAAATGGLAGGAAGGVAEGTPVVYPGIVQPMGTEVLVSRSPTLLRFTIPPQRFSLATLFGIVVVLFLMAGLAYLSAKVVSYRVPRSALYYFIPIWVPLIWLLADLLLPHMKVETVTVDSATCQLTIRRAVNGMTLPCCGVSTASTARITGSGVNFTVVCSLCCL
ncbi:unnamed protein product [Closterium sp. Naga37s-1]|nr:unnamed protein product [Closterium sp. Naga37s-1]